MNSFDVDEVAARTGLSRSMVYKLINAGELPAYRFGVRVRISESDLRAFVESRRHVGRNIYRGNLELATTR